MLVRTAPPIGVMLKLQGKVASPESRAVRPVRLVPPALSGEPGLDWKLAKMVALTAIYLTTGTLKMHLHLPIRRSAFDDEGLVVSVWR